MKNSKWRKHLASFALAALAVGACSQVQPKPVTQPITPPAPPPAYVKVPPPAPFEIRLPGRSLTPDAMAPNWDAVLKGAEEGRVHAVVQLVELPDAETRSALGQAGIELGQPLTGRAYLATVATKLDRTAGVLAKVRWAAPLQPEEKLAPALRDVRAMKWSNRVAGRTEVVVTLFGDADFGKAVLAARKLGAEITGQAAAARVFTTSIGAGREAELAHLDAVRYIEPTLPPGGDESDRARGFIGATVGAIGAGSPNGQGVIVGVLEGRHAQPNHPDFGNRVQQGDTGTLNVGDHATMTAGMIAGDGSHSVANGAANAGQWRGLAPAASVRTYNFTTSANSIADYLADVTDAVQSDGVHLMNNSWGDFGCFVHPYGAYEGRAPFLDGVVRGSLGRPVPIVFSAGNERAGFSNNNTNDTSCITNTTAPFANYFNLNHPKAAKNLITVGAIDSSNSAMTSYSSWGPTQDGRIKPDVVAAGNHNGTMNSGVSSITVPFGSPTGAANQQDYRTPIQVTPTFTYGWYAETSSAAAEVSGGLALMIDGWRRQFPGRADPLPSTLRAVLVHNAQDLDDATTWFNRGPDYASGYGLVRIDDSVASLQRGDAVEGSVPHQGQATYFINVATGTGPLRITLAWDDEPAVDGANPALVNDLDLVVTDPALVRHFPWTLNPADPSADAVRNAEDHTNNVEQVLVDSPAAGTWTVAVRGTSVASGRQNFSLVTRNGFTRQPVDLILALDTSDSMNGVAAPGGLDKIEVLRQSVQLLLETWNLHASPADRVGMAKFSSDVTTTPNAVPALQPFTANFNAILAAVGPSVLTAQGCTALGGALQVAFNSFDPNSPAKRAILMVTDGMQSANPFVGEAGTPSRLRIATAPAGGPLAFGAFFCTQTPAQGPGAGPIVPDGLDVAAHNAEIHAIGIGVNGAGFQQLVQRLAAENRGISHLTTTPDSTLDTLYINDLVRALKSTTLEVIATDAGALASGATKDIRFPVNGSSRSVTVVLSWKGANQIGAIAAAVYGPNGAVMTPDVARQSGFFTLLKFNLPGGHGAHPGNWRLALTGAAALSASHQVSILADETCLHYDFATPSTTLRAGEALSMVATVSEAGRPAPGSLRVQARIAGPAESLANLLSSAVPRTRAAQKYLAAVRSGRTEKVPASGAVLEAALSELARDPGFVATLRETEVQRVSLTSVPFKEAEARVLGAAQFTSRTAALTHDGAYSITWQIAGAGACGPVQREELSTILVTPANADRARTKVEVVPGRRGTFAVRVTPLDPFGNHIGPGRPQAMSLELEGRKAIGPLVDLLDGSYSQQFQGGLKGVGGGRITFQGESWTVPLSVKPR